MKTVQGKLYRYDIEGKSCYIYNGKLCGVVFISGDGEWSVQYADGVKYLPINSALKLLDYTSAKDYVIE